MASHTGIKKFVGGIACAVALTFVAAPAASAAKPDDKPQVSQVKAPKGGATTMRDTGWG